MERGREGGACTQNVPGGAREVANYACIGHGQQALAGQGRGRTPAEGRAWEWVTQAAAVHWDLAGPGRVTDAWEEILGNEQ